jgi:hypothetical protein
MKDKLTLIIVLILTAIILLRPKGVLVRKYTTIKNYSDRKRITYVEVRDVMHSKRNNPKMKTLELWRKEK